MSLARISAFEVRVASTAALKAEREATIRGLCAAVSELWVEMDFAPENAYEEAIAQQVGGGGGTCGCAAASQLVCEPLPPHRPGGRPGLDALDDLRPRGEDHGAQRGEGEPTAATGCAVRAASV